MSIKATIDTTLTELRAEASVLEQRLHLVRGGIDALQRLADLYYGAAQEVAVTAVTVMAEAPKPRTTVVPAAEAAIPYVAAPSEDASSADAAATSAPVQAARVTLVRAEPTEEDVAELQKDVGNWSPTVKREKLDDVYLMLLLRKDRFSANLPPTMDLKNPQVVRTLTNHLRHEAVPGYFQLCARLKKHQHLAYLYRRARDKATGAIFRAYPELFDAVTEVAPAEAEGYSPIPTGYQQEELPPTGAHHFAALEGLRSKATPEAAAVG